MYEINDSHSRISIKKIWFSHLVTRVPRIYCLFQIVIYSSINFILVLYCSLYNTSRSSSKWTLHCSSRSFYHIIEYNSGQTQTVNKKKTTTTTFLSYTFSVVKTKINIKICPSRYQLFLFSQIIWCWAIALCTAWERLGFS